MGPCFTICVPLFYSLYSMCARPCTACTLCCAGLRVGGAWQQPPCAGKHNPSPTLRLNKLKLRCPSKKKSLDETRSCSALRSGECNPWYLRTNRVAFQTAILSAALMPLLGCTTAFSFLLCGISVSKLHGPCTKLQSSIYTKCLCRI